MPILTIDAVEDPKQPLPAKLARSIADAAGQVLGSPEARTWVCLRRIPAGDYAENGIEHAPAPLLVELRLREPPVAQERERLVLELTQAIARASQRPAETVHLHVQPAAKGQQAFGGRLVR